MRMVYEIARQEFVRVLTYPLIPIVFLIILIIAYINGAGGAHDLRSFEEWTTGDALLQGFGQSYGATSMICTIMAIFLGATSIPYERWNGSINVLLTKPLYRRDYVIGKFMGLSGFMLLFNTFTLLFIGLLMIMFFRGPLSSLEFIWRLAAYIIIMSLSCSTVIALNMLFGVISKDILVVTSASMTYIFFDWIWHNERILGDLSILTPMTLYGLAIHPFAEPFNPLFNTTVQFYRWFSAALPFLAILFIEMLLFLLVGIYLFSREDNV
jgi:ABC-2 type transport system permease protein